MNNKGFVISTMLYSVFAIMLVTVFYILFILSNNRLLTVNSVNDIKSGLEEETITPNPGEEVTPDIPTYKDTSGANPPILAVGMIPVVYDETCNDNAGCWKKANIYEEWYDYDNQWWANAVTVTSENRSTYLAADPGIPIPMDDINTMWVWIPRFSYNIPNNFGSTNDVPTPPQINVKFESTISYVNQIVPYKNALQKGGTNTYYYIHPSFRDGTRIYNITPYDIGGWDKELQGFWAGKFNDATPGLIKPGESSHVSTIKNNYYASLNIAYDSKYGLNETNNTTDTHMMKNTEWGAVAYLSQSQYGKMGNSSYDSNKKEITCNFSPNTGYSSGVTYKERPSNINVGFKYRYTYNSNEGLAASTTGTIYGVYDMCYYEGIWVMGNYNNISDSYEFNGNLPERKYYDLYTMNRSFSIENYILGDATWETMNWYSSTTGWLDEGSPWYRRGMCGIFCAVKSIGQANTNTTSRTVLIP